MEDLQQPGVNPQGGMWVTTKEYARIKRALFSHSTLKRRIKEGKFGLPVRIFYKPNRQPAYEILITERNDIMMTHCLRDGRLPEMKTDAVKRQEKVTYYPLKVSDDFAIVLDSEDPAIFDVFLALFSMEKLRSALYHKKKWLKVSAANHKKITNAAKETGITITEAYTLLIQRFCAAKHT